MKCPKCGIELEEGLNFCTNCGTDLKAKITNETIIKEENKIDSLKGSYELPNSDKNINNDSNNTMLSQGNSTSSNDDMPTILCIISLVLYFMGGTIIGMLPILRGIGFLGPLAAIGIMIYVRVKYPNNLFGKVIMWIYIVFTILTIIGLVLLIMLCNSMAQSCRTLG